MMVKRLTASNTKFPNIAYVHKVASYLMVNYTSSNNHSTQMAALEYLVSVIGDVFIPCSDGNMAKDVEGHHMHVYL